MSWFRKNKVRYIYFYHATINNDDGLSTTHISGILTRLGPITSYDSYSEVRNHIAKDNGSNPSTIIIDELSFLHKTHVRE